MMYVKNKCIYVHAVNGWPKALERDKPTLFIAPIMNIVVDQILRGLKAFESK